jgi:hypothetical protein
VAGEPDVPDLSLLARALERFDDAPFREMPLGVVVVRALVDLPEIQIFGLQASQRLLELAHRRLSVPPVRAHLGHQKHAPAPILDRLAHPHFALAVVVFPRIVEEGDAAVDGRVHEAGGFTFGGKFADVVTPEPERRYHLGVPPEGTERNVTSAHDTCLCK